MKNTLFSLLLALLVGHATTAFAQTATVSDTTYYSVYSYIKVAPAMRDDYLKLEKAFKKIHAAKKKAGEMENWSLAAVMSPSGANCAYNYVARNGLRGNKQLAYYYEGNYMPKNWQSLLTPAEVALVNRTDEIRTIVKTEVWSAAGAEIFADGWEKTTKIAVWNYFSSPAGKTRADHIKMENDIWKPIHAARVKDGTMMGWVLLGLELPFGANQPYNMATIDLYTDMSQYLAPWFEPYFKKIHPGQEIPELMKQTNAATTLVKGEVRMIIDRLDWK